MFHFQTPYFDGGFIGVDVFFVISGYLMTAIIVGKLDAERFSLWDFYVARFTRIVPALSALSAVLLVFGWFYLDPRAYKLLAEYAGASVTFLSNIVYWREAGYFDATSQGKWMLHTWSLSAGMAVLPDLPGRAGAGRADLRPQARRLPESARRDGRVSFVLALVVARNNPEASFFLLPTRAWEMIAGGLVLLNAGRFPSRYGLRACCRREGSPPSCLPRWRSPKGPTGRGR